MTGRHRCVWELLFRLQTLMPLHFPLPNANQEGKWSPWGPRPDLTSDASVAAAEDKVSLEEQSCWAPVTPPPNTHSPPSQAGSGLPRQLSSSGAGGHAGSSCYKDTEQRCQRAGWVQERLDETCAEGEPWPALALGFHLANTHF